MIPSRIFLYVSDLMFLKMSQRGWKRKSNGMMKSILFLIGQGKDEKEVHYLFSYKNYKLPNFSTSNNMGVRIIWD